MSKAQKIALAMVSIALGKPVTINISDKEFEKLMERDCGGCQKNHDGFCDYFNEPIEDAYLIDCPCKVEATE